jgi:hypothetical protein
MRLGSPTYFLGNSLPFLTAVGECRVVGMHAGAGL